MTYTEIHTVGVGLICFAAAQMFRFTALMSQVTFYHVINFFAKKDLRYKTTTIAPSTQRDDSERAGH